MGTTAPSREADGAVGGMPAAEARRRTAKDLVEEWVPRLGLIRGEWAATLPAEAEHEWTRGAAYVRESGANSLGREAPDTQLRNALEVLRRKKVFVAADAVYFDVQSGTDIAGRAAFQRLFERAIAGEIKAIGVFISERLFRNLQQAMRVKQEFRKKGIELHYLGKFEGDERNPAAWQLETMQDATSEFHARNTGYHVGMHYEQASRRGQPPGRVPEVYRVVERAPAFLGRQGPAVRWEATEPLATILKDGCRRYLDGMSFGQVARWSETTSLGGVSPSGRVMDEQWWRKALENPRLAGYQMPTTYTGFKPGKESPPRPRLTIDSELVPCKLPALWTLEEYYAIRRKARAAVRSRKVRESYRAYLLSSIAYDVRCGHRLGVRSSSGDGRYLMRCAEREVGHRPDSFRSDLAAAELDQLIGSIQMTDRRLVMAVERELLKITAIERSATSAFRPNPGIAAAKKALAALGRSGFAEVREQLLRQIESLEREDEERRASLGEPVVQFKRALARLEAWANVWDEADTGAKNELLVAAGVRVWLGRLEDRKRGPARVVRIESESPMLALALATALPAYRTSASDQSLSDANASIDLVLDGVASGMASLEGRRVDHGGARLARPDVHDWRDADGEPLGPMPEWESIVRYRKRVGLTRSTAMRRVRAGQVEARQVRYRNRPVWIVRERAAAA